MRPGSMSLLAPRAPYALAVGRRRDGHRLRDRLFGAGAERLPHDVGRERSDAMPKDAAAIGSSPPGLRSCLVARYLLAPTRK
jgi:hypothetical protein